MSDPADKYRDRVDPMHKMAMDAIGMARILLNTYKDQYDTLIEAERSAHSIGHIIDPTLYRDMINSKSFAQQIKLCRAAQTFLRHVNAVADEITPAASGGAK
jgi:hypothetical protein